MVSVELFKQDGDHRTHIDQICYDHVFSEENLTDLVGRLVPSIMKGLSFNVTIGGISLAVIDRVTVWTGEQRSPIGLDTSHMIRAEMQLRDELIHKLKEELFCVASRCEDFRVALEDTFPSQEVLEAVEAATT
jgi:hypothetical protein